MKFRYQEDEHLYTLDGKAIPSLTQMLAMDGLNGHYNSVPAAILQAKAEWGTELHLALLRAEYGDGIDANFKEHCVQWLECCQRMKWGYPQHPIWKVAELPTLASIDGFVFGYTPDRASPEAVVEMKGTYKPEVSHGIQVALQVMAMGYPRSTPRWIAYFDKNGMKKLHHCSDTIKRNGVDVDVWGEAERIVFEHAALMETAA